MRTSPSVPVSARSWSSSRPTPRKTSTPRAGRGGRGARRRELPRRERRRRAPRPSRCVGVRSCVCTTMPPRDRAATAASTRSGGSYAGSCGTHGDAHPRTLGEPPVQSSTRTLCSLRRSAPSTLGRAVAHASVRRHGSRRYDPYAVSDVDEIRGQYQDLRTFVEIHGWDPVVELRQGWYTMTHGVVTLKMLETGEFTEEPDRHDVPDRRDGILGEVQVGAIGIRPQHAARRHRTTHGVPTRKTGSTRSRPTTRT